MIIRTGSFEILNSGSIKYFNDSPIEFFLAENFVVSIKISDTEKDNSSKEESIEYKVNESRLEINVKTFEKSTEAENQAPINIGILNNKKLFLNFRFERINAASNWLLNYTWYINIEEGSENAK
jgi:hypothetical protein